METADRPDSYNWFWIASLWAGLAVLDATQNVFAMRHEGMHHAWMKVFCLLTFDWLPWALVTPVVIWLGRRYPPAWKSPQTWLVHLCAIIAVDDAAAAWRSALEVVFQPWLPDFKSEGFLSSGPLKISGGLVP